jgi:hypothetical protein
MIFYSFIVHFLIENVLMKIILNRHTSLQSLSLKGSPWRFRISMVKNGHSSSVSGLITTAGCMYWKVSHLVFSQCSYKQVIQVPIISETYGFWRKPTKVSCHYLCCRPISEFWCIKMLYIFITKHLEKNTYTDITFLLCLVVLNVSCSSTPCGF